MDTCGKSQKLHKMIIIYIWKNKGITFFQLGIKVKQKRGRGEITICPHPRGPCTDFQLSLWISANSVRIVNTAMSLQKSRKQFSSRRKRFPNQRYFSGLFVSILGQPKLTWMSLAAPPWCWYCCCPPCGPGPDHLCKLFQCHARRTRLLVLKTYTK